MRVKEIWYKINDAILKLCCFEFSDSHKSASS